MSTAQHPGLVPVYLQFVTETGWKHIGSWFIRRFTWSHYSHVDSILPDGRLLGARSNAVTVNGVTYPAGVQIRPPNYLKFSKRLVATRWVTQAQHDAYYGFLQKQVGLPYNLENIFDFVFQDEDDPNEAARKGWICSVLKQAASEAAKFDPAFLNPNVPVQHIAPAHLLMAPDLVYDASDL